MPLVDTHCHLQDRAFDDDREEVILRSLEGLDWIVVVGDDIPSSREALALTRERVFATAGIHPYHAARVTGETLDEIRGWGRTGRLVALGEIGLDYFRHNRTPRDVQQKGFRRQLDLAGELGLPVVIHNRDSHDDLAAILDDAGARLPGGVMHCFAGGPGFVDRCVQWGFHISFAGNLTFPKAQALRDAALAVPLDRLLVETDSPYLAPQPLRGRRCEPLHIRHTLDLLAELRGIDSEELAEVTARNAARLFQMP